MLHIVVVQNSELVVKGTYSIIIYGEFWVLVGGAENTGEVIKEVFRYFFMHITLRVSHKQTFSDFIGTNSGDPLFCHAYLKPSHWFVLGGPNTLVEIATQYFSLAIVVRILLAKG